MVIYAQNDSNSQATKCKDPVIAKIIENGTTSNQTMKHLDILSNRFGGRLVGSDAYENAADWCIYNFKKWGLEVIKQEVGEVPVGFNRGPWFGRLIGRNQMNLHFVTPSYTAGTKGVQKGHVLKEPKTLAEFNKMRGKLKGAWVLIGGKNDGFPIDFSKNGDSIRKAAIAYNDSISILNKKAEKYNLEIAVKKEALKVQLRNNPNNRKLIKELENLQEKEIFPLKEEPALFYKEMKEAGILGIIQSASVPLQARYDRKNLMNITFDSLPDLPDIKLDEEQYDIIAKMTDRKEDFMLEFDIRNHFKMGPVKFHNIIGVIKGSEFPDEYVLIGGHLDAYDVATGAIDCGTGATVALEAARLISEAGGKPKRSIMFCLWAAEEFLIIGSKYFVESQPELLPKISNYFNRDGGPTVPTSITVPPAMYDDFIKICEPANLINKDFPLKVKKRKGEPESKQNIAGRSDHLYFKMNGVPALSFSTGDPKGYNFEYAEIWHTERDTYNKSIPEYMEQASVVTAVVAYGVANLDHLLNREGLYK